MACFGAYWSPCFNPCVPVCRPVCAPPPCMPHHCHYYRVCHSGAPQQLPFEETIPSLPLKEGQKITIDAAPKADGEKFTIVLLDDKNNPALNALLVLEVRLYGADWETIITALSYKAGVKSKRVSQKTYSLKQGEQFQLLIEAESQRFKIAVDSNVLLYFDYALPLTSAETIFIDGDLDLYNVTY